jgi:hypothetical protein
MGKRSNFERKKNDFYPTPYEALLPLLPHLSSATYYIEPCVGEGHLVSHLDKHDHICVGQYDLPDDVTSKKYDLGDAECFITNPPWTRDILHPAITNLRQQLPTWLLFDAGWMFTKQAKEHLLYCSKIVTIGRVKWIPDSKYGSLDDSCWYLFVNHPTDTTFHGKR